jgi:DNA-directed RNA polymerase specialized sigma subunit
MKMNEIIKETASGNPQATTTLTSIIRSILKKYQINDQEAEEIEAELITCILENDRNILDTTYKKEINFSYFKTWVGWHIGEYFTSKKMENFALYKIIEYSKYKLAILGDEEDIEGYIDFVKSNYAKYTTEEFYIDESNPQKVILEKESQEENNELCEVLKKLFAGLSEKEKSVLCAYFGYRERPNNISMNAYYKIKERIVKKLSANLKIYNAVYQLKELNMENCNVEEVCQP